MPCIESAARPLVNASFSPHFCFPIGAAFPYTRPMHQNPPRRLIPLLAAVLFAGFFADDACAAKKWRQYTDCQIIENPGNDGDSFHVKAGNIKSKTYLFRLYFVDTPESEKSLPERLREQADYFGIAKIPDIVKVGKEATKFTQNFLKDGFTVHSRLADAMGRSSKDRDYAMVMANGQDLGYELVRNGLARVYGMSTDLTDLDDYKRSADFWQRRLRQAELEAKKEKRGAWAYSGAPVSRMDALFAPREIEEQDVVLSRTIDIYPNDPAQTRPIGRLNPGVTVHVIKGISPDRAHVRFTTSSGQTYEGSARFIDLGL
jgi:endonuclease YncB( thermonuclease family)